MIYGLITLTALVVILLAILADVWGQLRASERRLNLSNRTVAIEVEWGVEMEAQRDEWRDLATRTLDNWIETIDAKYKVHRKVEELEGTIDRLVADKDIHVTLMQTSSPRVDIARDDEYLRPYVDWDAKLHSETLDLSRISFSQFWTRSDIEYHHKEIAEHIASRLLQSLLKASQ